MLSNIFHSYFAFQRKMTLCIIQVKEGCLDVTSVWPIMIKLLIQPLLWKGSRARSLGTRVLSQPISLQWNRSLNVGNLRHIWERNPQRARSSKYECSTRCQTLILNQQIIKVNESLSSINQKILMRVTWDGHHRSTVFKEHLRC